MGGVARGAALVVRGRISFLGDVDAERGVVRTSGGEKPLKGRVLVFEGGRGSTVGSYVIYGLARKKLGPAAMVVVEAEPIIVAGCVLAETPLVSDVPPSILSELVDDVPVFVDGDRGVVLAGEGCADKP